MYTLYHHVHIVQDGTSIKAATKLRAHRRKIRVTDLQFVTKLQSFLWDY